MPSEHKLARVYVTIWKLKKIRRFTMEQCEFATRISSPFIVLFAFLFTSYLREACTKSTIQNANAFSLYGIEAEAVCTVHLVFSCSWYLSSKFYSLLSVLLVQWILCSVYARSTTNSSHTSSPIKYIHCRYTYMYKSALSYSPARWNNVQINSNESNSLIFVNIYDIVSQVDTSVYSWLHFNKMIVLSYFIVCFS